MYFVNLFAVTSLKLSENTDAAKIIFNLHRTTLRFVVLSVHISIMQFPPLSWSEKRWFGGTTAGRSVVGPWQPRFQASGRCSLGRKCGGDDCGGGGRERRPEIQEGGRGHFRGEIASHLWEWRRYDKMAEIWRHGLVLITKQTKPVICKTPFPDFSGKAPRGQYRTKFFDDERRNDERRMLQWNLMENWVTERV